MARGKKHTDVTPLTPYIPEFLEWQRLKGRSEDSMRSWHSTLSQLAAFSPGTGPQQLNGREGLRLLTRFLTYKREHDGATSLAPIASHLRSFTAFLAISGYIKEDPGPDLPRPKRAKPRPRPLTDAQVEAILLAAANESPWDRLAAMVYIGIGLRKMEFSSVQLRSFDLDSGVLRFTRSKPQRPAVVPITAGIRLAVEACYAAGGKPTDYVLHLRGVNNATTPARVWRKPEVQVGPGAIHRWWERTLVHADVPHTRLHNTRHTAGSRFYHATKDAALTSEVMGHADIRTTMAFYVEPDHSAMVSGLEKAEEEGLGR